MSESTLPVLVDPHELTLEQIAEVYPQLEQLKAWIRGVEDYALTQAIGGNVLQGYELKTRASRRAFSDEDEVKRRLQEKNYTLKQIVDAKLKSLTHFEALLGKEEFNKTLGDLIETKPGSYVLQPIVN
jgi:hypothetical protein